MADEFDSMPQGFAPSWTRLRYGTPEAAALDPAPIAAALDLVAAWTRPDPATGRPMICGAVTLMAHDGVVVSQRAVGQALRYADGSTTELPADQQVPMRPDTIFDMASVSKVFTSIAVMQLHEAGRIDLTQPVAAYLPEFGVNGKQTITVEQLLTHTSGLVAWLPLWRDYPDRATRIKAALGHPPVNPPGSTYRYSDLNLIALGVLVERLTGAGLDTVVRERITEPLGMVDTGYNPPASKLGRVAAAEYMTTPPRGMVRGSVHDENAWSLGGVAGHAGIFSTARDMSVLAQAILNGGSYAGRPVLRSSTVRMMLTDYNQEFPGHAHGLGFELNQRWYMGGLAGPHTAGHTGFTGTALVIDPESRSFTVMLTNRVHPSRWGSINVARVTVATGLANALAVPPRRVRHAWCSGIGDDDRAPSSPVETTRTGEFREQVDYEDTDWLTWGGKHRRRHLMGAPLAAPDPDTRPGPAETLSDAGHRR